MLLEGLTKHPSQPTADHISKPISCRRCGTVYICIYIYIYHFCSIETTIFPSNSCWISIRHVGLQVQFSPNGYKIITASRRPAPQNFPSECRMT